MSQTFCHKLLAAAARPHKTAMTLLASQGACNVTFGEMLAQVRGVAFCLHREQIGKGDRVALPGENHPHWAMAYFTTLLRGAVAVPLDPAASNEALTAFLAGSQARLAKFRAVCERLGLSENVAVGIGAFDAHMGAVGAGIEPYSLCKVIGTSTCDMLVALADELRGKLVRGICGQVDGSILPGLVGMEAGQSAFGDVYAWFQQLLWWPLGLLDNATKAVVEAQISDRIIPELSRQAEQIPLAESALLALDWLNGRRTPDANQRLKAAITGLKMSRAVHLGPDAGAGHLQQRRPGRTGLSDPANQPAHAAPQGFID